MSKTLYFIRFLTFVCTLFIVHDSYGYEQRNLLLQHAKLSDIQRWVSSDKSWVSYPKYADREGWNKLTGAFKDKIVAGGEKYLRYEWKVVKATDFLAFDRQGSRSAMQNPISANIEALSSLIIAELSEGKGRFLDQIINGIWLFSEMSSWVYSAHLPSFQHSRSSLPDNSGHVIDLCAADLGALLSWTYYFFKDSFDKVHPAIAPRLRNTLKERILDPYMQRSDFSWQAFNLKPGGIVNNWNPWCNFNVLTCLLLLEDDPDKLAVGVYRTMTSVDKFINYNKEDGACEEGPSYWGHAAGKMYDYLQLLSYATDGRVNLFKEPIIKNLGEYISRSYVGGGWVVNFADASAKVDVDMSIIYQYGAAVESLEMQQFAAYLYERNNKIYTVKVGRDLFRALEGLTFFPNLKKATAALPEAAATAYPETEFYYLKNNKIFLAAKGGFNNESHNHNDVGTFSLYVQYIPFFIDIGVGTYTGKTFSKDRYSIWTMQSAYHNLPRINGYDQAHGAMYKSSSPTFKEREKEFSLDISKAYPEAAGINAWKRLYRLKQDKLYIIEQYDLENPTVKNEINFMTWATPVLKKEGEIFLHADDADVKMKFDPKVFEAHIDEIVIDDNKLESIWGKKVFRVVLKNKTLNKKGKHAFEIEVI